ncbi:hypothetical protein [Nocardia asiatica]|uniref:hypothetical protein n=1 Tax=Nocardia asiatica TaxID=209252 RepID=UPI0002F13A34|nr:hypothetical protein [Nocardia asiatica]
MPRATAAATGVAVPASMSILSQPQTLENEIVVLLGPYLRRATEVSVRPANSP